MSPRHLKRGCVVDGDGGDDGLAIAVGCELEEGFEAVHGSDDGGGFELDRLRGDGEMVGLILIDGLYGSVGAGDVDGEAGDGSSNGGAGNGNSAGELKAGEGAIDGSVEAFVGRYWCRRW